MKLAYGDIRSEIERFEVFDSHEHIEREAVRLAAKADLFRIFFKDYTSSDLVSAGMPRECSERLRNVETDIAERWACLEPYWKRTSNTGYGRAVLRAIHDLYGIKRLSSEVLGELNDRIRKANAPGLYKRILGERCRITKAVLDMMGEPYGAEKSVHNTYFERIERVSQIEKPFFVLAIRFDDFIWLLDDYFIKEVERKRNLEIRSLKDWVMQLGWEMDYCKREGVVAVKSGLAYDRLISYERSDEHTADAIFQKLRREKQKCSWTEVKPLQDYMMHALMQYASQYNLVVQFHTGLQEGNGNTITNSNPTHLANLLIMYPNLRFALLHGGYPYGLETAALVKNFPNAFVDMSWLYMISPHYSEWYLEELLDVVPSNKIIGFGGDAGSVEVTYGHLALAKDVIARVLAKREEQGDLPRPSCLEIAARLMKDNAQMLYSPALQEARS